MNAGQTDGWFDRPPCRTERLSGRDARMHLVSLVYLLYSASGSSTYLLESIVFPCFWQTQDLIIEMRERTQKPSLKGLTDGPTVGPTDRLT